MTVLLVVSGMPMVAQESVSRESNTDRPGSDYRNLELPQPDPGLCQQECARDGRCKAYVYVRPGVQGQAARCWLKESVPGTRSDSCCVSGVKMASAGGGVSRTVTLEAGTDRAGGDYRSFELNRPEAEICRQECAGDSKCRAYVYVKPGVQGPSARCWLKESIPPARRDECCVSGVKSN